MFPIYGTSNKLRSSVVRAEARFARTPSGLGEREWERGLKQQLGELGKFGKHGILTYLIRGIREVGNKSIYRIMFFGHRHGFNIKIELFFFF